MKDPPPSLSVPRERPGVFSQPVHAFCYLGKPCEARQGNGVGARWDHEVPGATMRLVITLLRVRRPGSGLFWDAVLAASRRSFFFSFFFSRACSLRSVIPGLDWDSGAAQAARRIPRSNVTAELVAEHVRGLVLGREGRTPGFLKSHVLSAAPDPGTLHSVAHGQSQSGELDAQARPIGRPLCWRLLGEGAWSRGHGPRVIRDDGCQKRAASKGVSRRC